MATTKQKRVAKLIIENATLDKPLNGGQMLEKVRYSKGMQIQPSRVLESVGVKEALNDYGFNEDNAKKVVSEIMLNNKERADSRLKATDQVFKVHKSYGEGGDKPIVTINIINPLQKIYGDTGTIIREVPDSSKE